MSNIAAAITDTETASIKGGVCDVAFIGIDENLEIVRTFESLIDPQCRIVPAAQAVHGIAQHQVENEPTAAESRERDGNPFDIDGLVLIGHNIKFDVRVLEEDGWLQKGRYVQSCTLRMARNLWPDLNPDEENHKLGTLAIMFGLETGPAHRAMGDCVTCLNLLRYIADHAKVGSFQELIDLGRKPLSLDNKMSFGKHRGMKLSELPYSYVQWMRNQDGMDPEVIEALAVRRA